MDTYPALQDVYDLATEDLKKIQQQLQANPNGHQDLLQAIILEIQQRKILEYFTEVCHAENPYAKKVAAFNQQFLKLAAEAIQKNHNARSQGVGIYEPSQLPLTDEIQSFKKTSKSQPEISNQILSQSQSQKRQSYLDHRQYTDNDSKSMQSDQASHSDAISTTTTGSINGSKSLQTSSRTSKVKMNIGTKDGKGKIKEILKNTLAKTLIEEEIVIKRNNANLQQNKINPHKKYHIPGEKHEKNEQVAAKPQNAPNSEKSIKSKQELKAKQQQKSTKNIKTNSQDAKKKKQNSVKPKEEHKKDSVKLPKLNNQDLVAMVKQEEQKRKEKALRMQNQQKLPQIENRSASCQPQYSKQEGQKVQTQIDEEIQSSDYQKQCGQNEKQINKTEIQQKVQNEVIQQQEIQQSLSPQKLEKASLNSNNANLKPVDKIVQNKIQQHHLEKAKIEKKQKLSQFANQKKEETTIASHNQRQHQKETQPQQNPKLILQKTVERNIQNKAVTNVSNMAIEKKQSSPDENAELKASIDYTKKLLQQIDRQEQNCPNVHKYSSLDWEKEDILSTDSSTKTKQKKSEQRTQDKEKKCYSQEYWAHIRQQAELKIKRFKQEKQYEEKKQSKKSEKIQNSFNSDIVDDVSSNDDQNSQDQISNAVIEKLKSEDRAFEQQMAKRGEELNKLKKEAMKKTNKKVAEAQPQKITFLRPKPQFNYLSVYPSFNHIFSVMYLKPVSQALNDIPNIMREVKTLFSTHMQHFSNRSNFKPAIFLPFDHNGTFQLTDPKQLIAHAQQTYIDLKTMIERVEIFNQNLHGEFNNTNDDRFYRVVKTKEEVYDIITTSFMRRKGWRELPHGCSLRTSWNLFWSWSKPDVDLNKLLIWQRINHFPFNKNLSRKDLLYKNLDMFRKSYKVPMNFLPLTFNLPKQFSQLSAKFHEQEMLNKDNNFWIMKPIGKSRGRGIKVVSSLSQLNYTDNIVVQKYIINPMLIDGYKFDMRIYVLVTSFHPLEAFVYKEGFARLSTQKYTLDAHSIKNTFVHLTNFAINKNNVSSNTNFAGGSKISLKTLKDKITRMGHSFSNIWGQVHDIIIKSLLGCSVSVPSFPTAFELFGYDIMIDQQCNCHLIQINASPSLQRSYMIDEIVKQNLIDDIVDLVDPPDFDKGQLIDVFNQRIQAITNKKKISPDEDLIGLARILKYKPIRKPGEKPLKMGLFETVAPCDSSRELEVLIKARSGANNPQNID